MTSEMITNVLIALISVGGTALITAIISETVKQIKGRKSKEKDELKSYREQERDKELKEEILTEVSKTLQSGLKEGTKELKSSISDLKTETEVLAQKITVLEDRVGKQGTGLTASLRNDIYKWYCDCREKGYRTTWETQDVDDMYGAYHALGGNNFIDDCVWEFKKLDIKD